ncbi:MAG: hypothetical protein HKN36_04110 [Hellea sp.]|nr:hypothetical protein [Hellea sp.]
MPNLASTTQTAHSFQKPSVIINLGSGSADDITDEICDLFDASGLPKPQVHAVDPSKLSGVLEQVGTDQTDLLIVFGGDGTCMAGAKVARKSEIPFIALPGGTMNLLPKALYGTNDWREALDIALSTDEPRWQSAGKIDEHIFFCGAIMGDPTIMSEARESVRDGDEIEAVKRVPDIMSAVAGGLEFSIDVDGDEFDRASGLLRVSCPAMQDSPDAPTKFEVASLPQLSLGRLIAIGAKALTSEWTDSPDVKTAHARQVSVDGQQTCDVLLDGESHRLSCPIKISLEPEAVLVLAPSPKKIKEKS